MTIESTIVGAAESAVVSTAESAVSSVATGVISTVAGGLLGSPMAYLKMAGYAVIVAGLIYVGYRVVSYVEQAAADHAEVQVITAQRDTAIRTANDNAAAKAASDAQHDAAAASAVASLRSANDRTASLESILETLRHAPKSVGCVPSAAARHALDGLRK